ncbi:hypothetical protein JX265_005045 [Neoarthrinium moseri]|uniref:RRM domain-containing protein n=1 Tax=Neoarthrinium moseri TaxID=1658444 RepID=A0A9P9WPL7_9PEZI|nr:hypothetical protein JX265_005045 [Neoarthrinium moseri]
MAPELRTRKASASTQKPAAKPKETGAAKRKAADEASPIAPKKTKSVKPEVVSKKPSKKSKPVPEVIETAPAAASDDEHAFSDEDEDQALALAGVSDSEDDEAEVKDGAAFKEGQDVGKAPTPSKEVEKAAKDGKGTKDGSAVVYIGRIPHGFYEHEMKSYFCQFGDITRLRLSRNKRTGASKHFAFVEFSDESTAEIVSKTMNNYLLFGHLLKCRLVPKAQVHESLFKGANKRYKAIPHNKIAGYNLKKPLSEDKWAAKIEKENEKRAKKAEKLKALGYEFEAPELATAIAPKEVEALEGEEKDAPKAIEAAPEASEPEEDLAVKKPAKASKQDGAKAAKKAKKPKKAKA